MDYAERRRLLELKRLCISEEERLTEEVQQKCDLLDQSLLGEKEKFQLQVREEFISLEAALDKEYQTKREALGDKRAQALTGAAKAVESSLVARKQQLDRDFQTRLKKRQEEIMGSQSTSLTQDQPQHELIFPSHTVQPLLSAHSLEPDAMPGTTLLISSPSSDVASRATDVNWQSRFQRLIPSDRMARIAFEEVTGATSNVCAHLRICPFSSSCGSEECDANKQALKHFRTCHEPECARCALPRMVIARQNGLADELEDAFLAYAKSSEDSIFTEDTNNDLLHQVYDAWRASLSSASNGEQASPAVTSRSAKRPRRTAIAAASTAPRAETSIKQRTKNALTPDKTTKTPETPSMANAGSKSSRFRGVSQNRNNWTAQITINGKKRHLGTFPQEEDAAKAYDLAARENLGEEAHTNF